MIVILEGRAQALRAYRRPETDGAEWDEWGDSEPTVSFDLPLEDALFPKLARGFVEFTQGCVLTGPWIGEIYGALQQKFLALGFPFRRRILEMGNPLEGGGAEGVFDAAAYWRALCARAKREGLAGPREYVARAARWSTGTSFIARAEFDAIPARPGVYRFFDEEGRLLYVGKSVSLRKRVLDHLQGTQLDAKDRKLKARAVRIEWDETGSDLLALLRESEEIQTLHPLLNRAQRRRRTLVSVVVEPTAEGYLRLGLSSGEETDTLAARERQVIALPSRSSARALLERLRREQGLCDELCGRDGARRFAWPPSRPCFGHQIGRCGGPCAGEESVESYNARVEAIVARLRADIGGSFVLVAEGRHARERGFAWVVDGRYLGYGFVESGRESLDADFISRARAALQSQGDTRDARRILKAFLADATEGIIKISLDP
jgi:hypothetical protein